MADEEVIKRRLLIDGDGTGDDRRLNILIKNFIKWVNTSDSPENIQSGYDRLLSQIAHIEFAATKSEYAARMMKQELRNYEAISQTIDSAIEQAKTQIAQSKENLVLAKRIRKNRMEYDVLAKIIGEQPDRRRTTEKLDALKAELAELEQRRTQLRRKLEVRGKDFAVLMRSIRELQSKLDDDVRLDGGEQGDEKGGVVAEEEEEAEEVVLANQAAGLAATISPISAGSDSVLMDSVDDDDDDEDDVVLAGGAGEATAKANGDGVAASRGGGGAGGGGDGLQLDDVEMVSADNSIGAEGGHNNNSSSFGDDIE